MPVNFPLTVKPADIVNKMFGPDLVRIKGGTALYDEVWMKDGGNAMYLVRLLPDDLTVSRRWIPWETELEIMYNPDPSTIGIEIINGRVEINDPWYFEGLKEQK